MLYTVDVAVMLRSNSNVTFQCAFHVVWCPKYRRPVIGGRMEQRLTQLVGEERGAWLVGLETMPDHVHLLVEVDPRYGVHRLVKAIKGRRSRVLREEFPWLKGRLADVVDLCLVRGHGRRCPAVGGQAVRRAAEEQVTRCCLGAGTGWS